MKRLKRAIILAAKLHEESFEEGVSRISLRKACDMAAENVGFDLQGTEPVFLLLANSWNRVLKWANE